MTWDPFYLGKHGNVLFMGNGTQALIHRHGVELLLSVLSHASGIFAVKAVSTVIIERNQMTTCDKCGGEVRVGDWPFCKGDPNEHNPSWKFGFDPFEPYIDPNIDAYGQDVGYNRHLGRMLRGTLVTSREHRRALMKKNNLDWAGRRDEGREL